MLATAVITLLSYQLLDPLGHVAAEAYDAGNHGMIVRAVAAFDVFDDTLDHGPDRHHASASQQVVIVGLPCCAKAQAMPLAAAENIWIILPFLLPANLLLSEVFRPPRS